ncbi:MAG: hypothetical protein H0U52_02970 [Chloroflexi bacterium]|nr:hypothetical protein [Chloroflexota bacterium]
MTTQPPPTPARRRSRWFLRLLLGLTLLVAVAVGAYYNWYLWHPMSGIVVTFIGLILVLVGGVAVSIRNSRVRPVALILIVAGVGAIMGQNVGPDRPETRRHETGSLRLVLTAPATFDASGAASCGSTADASQVVVDPGEFGLARASEDADFHYVSVTIGDMYDFASSNRRSDHLRVSITVQSARIPADLEGNGRPGATMHTSDAASDLTLLPGHTLQGGSVAFSNLSVGEPPDPARRSDLAGTITWTCGPVTVFDPGATPRDQPPEEGLSDPPLPS